MTRRVLAVVVLVAIGACGLGAEERDHPIAADEVPYDLLARATTTTTEPPPPTSTTLPWRTNLWYVAGDSLAPTTRQLQEQPGVPQVLRLLLAGPSGSDEVLLRSALEVADARAEEPPADGQLTIDLRDTFGDRSSSEQILALAQLVFTVTEVPGVGRVVFRIGGAELDVPLPNGQLAQGPVSRDDYASLVYPTLPVTPAG